MVKTVFKFFRPDERIRTDQYIAGQSIQMPQWSRRRRRIAIIKRVTRVICMLLIGIGVALIAFSGFASAALAAPPHKATADGQIVLDAGLAALKNGNVDVAILHFQPLAEADNPHAQFALAMIHAGQFGNKQDKSYNPERAHHLMAAAAARGHKEAQFQLGLQFITGVGVPANFERALLCLTIAARNRHVRAQIYLAVILDRIAKFSKGPPATKAHHQTRAYKWALIALQTAKTSDIGAVANQKLVEIATTLKAGLSYGHLLHANAAARIFNGTTI